MTTTRKITKIQIRNYRGISALEAEPGDGATIAVGKNAAGKSTLLNAIRAALAARDIGPDAIRHGHDSAEILIDLDDLSVRRAITKSGSTLVVSRDGFDAKKPQTMLTELLGASPLDPLDILLLKPKERRARILEALPCVVTREQLLSWAPSLPDGVDVSGHGLEVVERVRTLYYDRRTAANAKAKGSAGEAERAAAALGDARVPEGPDAAAALALLEGARREEQRLTLLQDEAAAQEKRHARARASVAEKRAQAESLRGGLSAEVDLAPLADEIATVDRHVANLRKQLAETEGKLALAQAAHTRADTVNHDRTAKLIAIAQQELAATELEATLADGVQPPSQESLVAAKEAVQQANVALAQAKGAEAIAKQAAEVAKLVEIAEVDAIAAHQLDVIVKRLTDEAPRAIANADSIPGLKLDGESVTLDGVGLDTLCGAEQMRLCVEIARRASAKARFLVVDGLERIDEEQFDAFVREATKGGWQLFGSRVTKGGFELQHIGSEDT